ncbi:box C/D snoRNA protein 1-like isoform X2 [Chiloscyllium punctatum]|uniref:box C/D snoRNA protein 1-like isoform X2 n=1 Tax=Chiloscyllium punctatum TaxID=137246 RepID=UPI003B63D353
MEPLPQGGGREPGGGGRVSARALGPGSPLPAAAHSPGPGSRGDIPIPIPNPSPSPRADSPIPNPNPNPSPSPRADSPIPSPRVDSPVPIPIPIPNPSPKADSPSPNPNPNPNPRARADSVFPNPGTKAESPIPSAGAEGLYLGASADSVDPDVLEERQRCSSGKRKISLSGLPCVKKHKAVNGCNGVRDKTAFTPLSHFTEMHLLSDYRFLEDTGRLTDIANRDHTVHRPSTNKFLNIMKNRALKHNINLKLLPIGFTKRRENSTYFNKKEQMFYWHVKLRFPHSHTEYTEKRVPSIKTLQEVLRKYVDPVEADPVIRQKLKVYTMVSLSELRILMKVENRKHNSVRYYELNSTQSLIENLSHKTVIEYPTLHVVLKMNSPEYRLLSDVDSNEDAQNSTDLSSESSLEEGEIKDNSETNLTLNSHCNREDLPV